MIVITNRSIVGKPSEKGFKEWKAAEIFVVKVNQQKFVGRLEEETMSERFLMCLDAGILAADYPIEKFDELTWKVLFYLYRHMDLESGCVIFTHGEIQEEFGFETSYENWETIDALYELAENGLLNVEVSCTGHLFIEMLSARNGPAVQRNEEGCDDISFNIENLYEYDIEHVLIPLDIFDQAVEELSLSELRLLLLLYKYRSAEEMDGVDPEPFSIMGGIILINSELMESMGLCYGEIVECYTRLKELRYLFTREIHITTLKNEEIEKRVVCPNIPPNGCKQIVLSLERTSMYTSAIIDGANCGNLYTGGLYE